jgi:hypothetical protein
MNIWEEFDFKRSWTEAALDALTCAATRVDLGASHDPVGDIEAFEDMVGLGFVAIQTYITQVGEVFARLAPPGRTYLLHRDSRFTSLLRMVPEETVVSVVWGMADFYKHHDEWPPRWGIFGDTALSEPRLGWLDLPAPFPPKRFPTWESVGDRNRARHTLRVLDTLGIKSLAKFPCLEALCLLRGIVLAPVRPDGPRIPDATVDFREAWAAITTWRDSLLREVHASAVP